MGSALVLLAAAAVAVLISAVLFYVISAHTISHRVCTDDYPSIYSDELKTIFGDYVLSGGELPAAVIADAVIRLIPGAIGDEQSALNDSFQDNLLEAPVYTRPAEFNGWKVPDVLLSGNPKLIKAWQDEQSLERTRRLRPYLLKEE